MSRNNPRLLWSRWRSVPGNIYMQNRVYKFGEDSEDSNDSKPQELGSRTIPNGLMLLIAVMTMLLTAQADEKSEPGHGWTWKAGDTSACPFTAIDGTMTVADTGAMLSPKAVIRSGKILTKGGLYALRLTAQGQGSLRLSVKPDKARESSRGFLLQSESGVYGLLFEMSGNQNLVCEARLLGESLTIESVELAEATSE